MKFSDQEEEGSRSLNCCLSSSLARTPNLLSMQARGQGNDKVQHRQPSAVNLYQAAATHYSSSLCLGYSRLLSRYY